MSKCRVSPPYIGPDGEYLRECTHCGRAYAAQFAQAQAVTP